MRLKEGLRAEKEWLETDHKNRRVFRQIVPGILSLKVGARPDFIFLRRSWFL
jgi:hypothetical protein